MDYDERSFVGMSAEMGDPVLASLMSANRTYCAGTEEEARSLGKLFHEESVA